SSTPLNPDALPREVRIRIERRGREEPQDAERGGPDDFEGVDDLLPEPRHDRRHGHDRGDPDDYAEDGEPRAQLVGPQLVDRDQPAFANGVEGHAIRRATLRSD